MQAALRDAAKFSVGTFATVIARRQSLARALVAPFAVQIALDSSLARAPDAVPPAAYIVAGLVYAVVYAVIAVTVHRMVLIGPDSVPRWGIWRFGAREFRFIVTLLALVFILVGLAFALSLVLVVPLMTLQAIQGGNGATGAAMQAARWLMFGVSCYLTARLSLVFPAVALDRSMSFSDSWRLTANYQGLMIFITVIFPVAVSLPLLLLADPASIPVRIILRLLNVITLVLVMTALSLAYAEITRD